MFFGSRYVAPSPTSNVSAKVNSFAMNTTTGNQAITGVGFQPKVVLFWIGSHTTDGISDNSLVSFGVGISSSDRRAINSQSTTGGTTSTNVAANQNTFAIYSQNGNPKADLVSLDSDGFTINITAAPTTGQIVNFLALGGSGLTNVKSGSCAAKTTTGTQAYTGVGFQPDCVIFFAGKYSTEVFDAATNGASTFGFAINSSQRGCVAWRSKNNANPQVAKHRQSTGKAGISLTDTGIFTEFDFVSMDADGFTLNFTTAGGTADYVYYVALKGGNYKIGSLDQPTSTGNQTISGVGFTPKAALFASANDTSANNDATNTDAKVSVGATTGTSERFARWAGDVHNASPTQANHIVDRANVIKLYTPGSTPTLNAAADLNAFNSDGLILNWTTVDATQRQVLYLMIG